MEGTRMPARGVEGNENGDASETRETSHQG